MTELTVFQREISARLPDISLSFFEPMKGHTSFKIGGPAEVMAFPKSVRQLQQLLEISDLLDIKTYILGAGTNVLAPDEGLPGLVICLKDGLDTLEQTGSHTVAVGAGVSMARAAMFAASLGLSGLEFAHGIPGSVGGGVYMNAGAYGGEIKDVCTSVQVMGRDGSVRTVSGEAMGFSYRHSRLEETGEIVLAAEFTLTPKPQEEIQEQMQLLIGKRRASQPLDKPSAGSAFKRPATGYAAALIDGCGLKGYQVGGAAVSQKHAGFAVNLGDATAQDVKALLADVARKVEKETGILLEPEVRIW